MHEKLERATNQEEHQEETCRGKVQKCHKARAHKQLKRRRKRRKPQITMPNGAFDAGENGENDDKQKDFAKRLVFLPPPLLLLFLHCFLCCLEGVLSCACVPRILLCRYQGEK